MKGYYLILLLLLATGDYARFIEVFPKAKLNRNGNFLTRSLKWDNYTDLEEKYPIVSEESSFVFLCDQDSSKLFYEYDLYHMEEGYLIEHVKENFVHHAIASFRKKEYDMAIYSKYGIENYYHFLRSFDQAGNKVNELLINEVNFGDSFNAYSYSYKYALISEDSLSVYSYMNNQPPDNVKNDTLMETKVLIEKYSVDNKGSFNLTYKDSLFLKGNVSDYNNFNMQPNADDPIAKYWTQW